MRSRTEEDLLPLVSKSSSFRCLYDLLAYQAEHRPDAIAIATPERTPLEYARLHRQVEETVRCLNGLAEKLGLTAGQARLGTRPDFVAPRTPVEEALAEIWAQVLGVKRVGVHDDFFELGGDSMLATQIVSRVRRAMRVELAPLSFFETPTVADLAATVTDRIEEAEREDMARILAELEELSEEEAEHLLASDENAVNRDER